MRIESSIFLTPRLQSPLRPLQRFLRAPHRAFSFRPGRPKARSARPRGPASAASPPPRGPRSAFLAAALLLLGLVLPGPGERGLLGGLGAGLAGGNTARAQTPAPAPTTTQITGDVVTNTTWARSQSPFEVTKRFAVKSGAILTIEAGVEVRFQRNTGLTVGKGTAGSLVAVGTAAQPIVFTSKLPSHRWDGLHLADKTLASSRIEHVRIERCRTGLQLVGAPTGVRLRHGTIREVRRDGVFVERTSAVLDGWAISAAGTTAVYLRNAPRFELRNSTLHGAIFVPQTVNLVLQNNSFRSYAGSRVPPHAVAALTADRTGTTAKTAIEITRGTLANSASWPALTYQVRGTLTVEGTPAPVLTLAAGTTFHFVPGWYGGKRSRLVVEWGGLVAVGTTAAPILFTTDPESSPLRQVMRITLGRGTLATTRLEHVIIEHAGTGLALDQTPAGVTLRRGTVRKTTGPYGIYIRNAASPVLDSWTVASKVGQLSLHVAGTKSFTLRNSTLHGALHAPTATSATLENNTFRSGFHAPQLATATFTGNSLANYGSWVARVHPNLVGDVVSSISGATSQTVMEVSGGPLSRSATWPAATYRIVDRLSVEGSASPVLTVAAGTTLRFAPAAASEYFTPDSGLVVGQTHAGGLIAVGTAAKPITFGVNAESPKAGAWPGVELRGKTLATSRLEHVVIEYAHTGLRLVGTPAGVALRQGTVRHSQGDGIYVENASPVLDGWTISQAGAKAVHIVGTGAFTLRNATLHGALHAPKAIGATLGNNTFHGVLHLPKATTATLENNTFRGGFHAPQLATATFTGNTFANYGSSVARVHPNLAADVASAIPGANAQTVIEVTGAALSRSATWPARSYRIVGRLVVAGSASPVLTLAGGTAMRFAVLEGESSAIDLSARGYGGPGGIVVLGTASKPVRFTSDAATPKAGAWDGITLRSTTLPTSRLEHVNIEYPATGLRLEGTSPKITLQHGSISDASRDGIAFENTSPVLDGWSLSKIGRHALRTQSATSFTLRNSRVLGALHIPTVTSAVFANNTFSKDFSPRLHPHLVASFAAGLPPAAKNLVIEVSGGVSTSTSWPARVYRVVNTLGIAHSNSPILTVAAGTTLRFAEGAGITVGLGQPGGLIAVGTEAAPIRFTADAATPAAGFWSGIALAGKTTETSRLEHVVIEYCQTGLELNGISPSVTLRHGSIRHASQHGVRIVSGALALEHWTITQVGLGAMHADSNVFAPSLTVRHSTLEGGLYLPFVADAVFEHNVVRGFSPDTPSAPPASWQIVVPAHLVEAVATSMAGATAQSKLWVSRGTLERSASWPARTYYLSVKLTVAGWAAPILTLAAGSTVRCGGAGLAGIDVGSGNPGGLIAVGTSDAPILFAAMSEEQPTAGSWAGLSFSSYALGTSRLEHVTIEYANRGLSLSRVEEVISFANCRIRHTKLEGVRIELASPSLSRCAISSTGGHGLSVLNGSPQLSHLTISGAGDDGAHLSGFSGRLAHSSITGSQDDGVECVSCGRVELFDNRITGNAGRGFARAATAHIEGNTITGNGVGIELTAAPALLAVHHNDLSGNTVPIKSTATAGVDARWNWWGSAAGPTGIVGQVRTDPWLGAAPSKRFRIEDAVASPQRFAPGGTASVATLTARTPQAARWSLAVRDSAGTTVRSFTATGTSFSQDWDGANAESAALAAGSYRYTLSARPSAEGGRAAAPVVGDLTLVAGDLVAEIASPGPEARLGRAASLVVRGRALGTGFSAYELDYAAGADPRAASFTRIARGTSVVAAAAALGTWNTRSLSQGVYTLRLRTLGAAGAVVEERVTVSLLALGAVAVTPRHFSPNGDGRRDQVSAEATATARGPWTAQVRSAAGAVLRSYAGVGSVPRIAWDGRNGAGVTQPEGTYTLALRVAAPDATPSEQTGTVVLDVTPPTAAITAPAEGAVVLDYEEETVTGTASDLHFSSYLLYVRTARGGAVSQKRETTAVVAGTLGTLADGVFAPRYVDGTPYKLELLVEDRAANRAAATRSLRFDRIRMSDLRISPRSIDPEKDETTRISYRLNRAATVTVQMVAGTATSEGGTTYTLVDNQNLSPGALTTTWNGKNAAGVPAARDLYYLHIVARDDAGRSAVYDGAKGPVEALWPVWRDLRFNGGPRTASDWTDVAVEGLLAATAFDPYRNDELRIEYKMSSVGRLLVSVRPVGKPEFVLRNHVPLPAGANQVIWTGRLSEDARKPYSGPFAIYLGVPLPLSNLSLVVSSPEFRVESFRANPYVFRPSHAQVVHLSYALRRAARVQVDIVDPEGNHWLRLQEATAQEPGTYRLEWSGRNAAGKIAAPEGLYTIEVTATETGGRGDRTVRRGNLLVYR